MGSLVISGENTSPLSGIFPVASSKNATLPLLAASLLTEQTMTFSHVPHLKDITSMLEIMAQLGVKVLVNDQQQVELTARSVTTYEAPYELVKTMRASFLVLGPLLARFGEARVSLPGGCAIGSRPIDLHLTALRALGADITLDQGYIVARAPQGLQGGVVQFEQVTVTGTENILMAACLAQGTTRIQGAAIEPEVVDLARCLKKMGADITGEGTETIIVQGVQTLNGTEYRPMPDRIEAGTALIAAAIRGGEITVTGISPELLPSLLPALTQAGATIDSQADQITLRCSQRPKAVSIETAPFPGFPTDLQAQWMVLNTIADGQSTVTESVFENRFMHVQELKRLGAVIELSGKVATISGQPCLKGAEVTATDLRASACLVLAGMIAEGTTTIHRIYHIDRGYEYIEDKYACLGVDIRREVS